MDPKRPCLPEHPVNRTSGPNPSGQFGAVGGPMGGMPSQPPVSMMGFGQRSPHIMYGGEMKDYILVMFNFLYINTHIHF